jgi:hypothetical protein
MSGTSDVPGGAYQVALPGEFGPAYLAAFAGLGVEHTQTTSVFLLDVPDHVGIHDVTAMLQERGLVILGIRRVAHPPGMTRERTA